VSVKGEGLGVRRLAVLQDPEEVAVPLCSRCERRVNFGARRCPHCGVPFAVTRSLHLAAMARDEVEDVQRPDGSPRASWVPRLLKAISWVVLAVAGPGTLVLMIGRQPAPALACFLGTATSFGLLQAAAVGLRLLEEVRTAVVIDRSARPPAGRAAP
jgi:hypothetical protein